MNINNHVLQTAGSLTLTANQSFLTNNANTSDIIKRCIFYNASRIYNKTGQAYALLLILFIVSMAWLPFGTAHAVTATPSSVKWHSGHYYAINMGDKNNSTYMAKVYSELKRTPALRGVQIRYTWAELEKSYGVYNFSSIDKRLAELAAQNKRLVIVVQMKSFDPDTTHVPSYLKTDLYEGGVFAHTKGDDIVSGHNLKLWNSNVLSRMGNLMQALGKRYNSHPYFEGIGLTETSMGTPAIPLSSTQIDSFYNNLLIINQRMREEFFPNTMTFQFTNYPRPILESFIENLGAMGAGLGGPDTFIEDPGLNYLGNEYSPSGVYTHYPKLSGIVPLTPSVMQSNYRNTKWDGTGYEPTILELLTFARDNLKANYIFWTRDPDYFPQVLEMLNWNDQKNNPAGGLDPTCPSAYSSCVN